MRQHGNARTGKMEGRRKFKSSRRKLPSRASGLKCAPMLNCVRPAQPRRPQGQKHQHVPVQCAGANVIFSKQSRTYRHTRALQILFYTSSCAYFCVLRRAKAGANSHPGVKGSGGNGGEKNSPSEKQTGTGSNTSVLVSVCMRVCVCVCVCVGRQHSKAGSKDVGVGGACKGLDVKAHAERAPASAMSSLIRKFSHVHSEKNPTGVLIRFVC